jgi:hypothetical protein
LLDTLQNELTTAHQQIWRPASSSHEVGALDEEEQVLQPLLASSAFLEP